MLYRYSQFRRCKRYYALGIMEIERSGITVYGDLSCRGIGVYGWEIKLEIYRELDVMDTGLWAFRL